MTSENSKQDITINSKAEKNKVLLLDGSQSMNANLNLNNKKFTNLANATDNDDAVTFSELKNHTDSHLNNYHLQPSFTFFKNFGNEGNKGYAKEHFLKLDSTNNYFDLKQKVIKNTEPFYDGLFGDNDLVSKAFVDAEIAKLPKAP